MTLRLCMVCRDYNETLYKVCSCFDSVLCEDCLSISNTSNIHNCPICRRNLKIRFIRDYIRYCKLLIPNLLVNILVIIIPLIYPIHILINEYNEKTLTLFIITLYSVVLLQPIISYRISNELKIEHIKYLLSKLIIMIFLIPLLFLFEKKNRNLFYLALYIIPFYVLPHFFIVLIDIIDKKQEFKNYLNNKTITRQIKFEKIQN